MSAWSVCAFPPTTLDAQMMRMMDDDEMVPECDRLIIDDEMMR